MLERASAHALTAATLPANAAAGHGVERRVASILRDRAGEADDRARLREPLRHERRVEVGPRLDRDDGGPGNPGDERVEDSATSVRDTPRADGRVRDVASRGEPVADRADVRDLARPVDSHEPARLPVAACVEREHGVAPAREAVALDERVHLLSVPGEAVQEDDRRPAARRRGAVRDVQRRRDRDAVVHRDRDVLFRCDRTGRVPCSEEHCCQECNDQSLRHRREA